jgi:hypothetical protein
VGFWEVGDSDVCPSSPEDLERRRDLLAARSELDVRLRLLVRCVVVLLLLFDVPFPPDAILLTSCPLCLRCVGIHCLDWTVFFLVVESLPFLVGESLPCLSAVVGVRSTQLV